MSTTSFFKCLNDLNKFALAQVIPCVESVPINEYFVQAKSFLQQAAICQKTEDKEREYMFLVEYMILVIKRIPLHPQIYDNFEEYSFNKEKCYHIRGQIEHLREELLIRFGEKKALEPQKVVPEQVAKKVDQSFEDLDDKERSEIQEIIKRGEEKEKKQKRIRPLPGIDDFSCCMSENIRNLEKQKRTLYIYREIRTLKRKFRHGQVDFEKKIRQKEKQRALEKIKKEKEDKERLERERLEAEHAKDEQDRLLQERIKLEHSRVSDFLHESVNSPVPPVKQEDVVVVQPNPSVEVNKPQTVPKKDSDDFHLDDDHEEEPLSSHKVDDKSIDEFFN